MVEGEVGAKKRRHRAGGFYKDIFTTALEPDEVVTEVRFPVANGRHAYLKFRRRLFDWAIAGVAVQQTGSGWRVRYVDPRHPPRRGAAGGPAPPPRAPPGPAPPP